MYTHLSYDEPELLSLSSQGEEQAFIRLLRMHKHKLYSFLLQLTGSSDTAVDIIQQLFFTLWKKRESLVNVEEFDTYLFDMTTRQLLPALKKTARHRTTVSFERIQQLVKSCFHHSCLPDEKQELARYIQDPSLAHPLQDALLPVWNLYHSDHLMPDDLWEKLADQIADEDAPAPKVHKPGKTGLFGWLSRK